MRQFSLLFIGFCWFMTTTAYTQNADYYIQNIPIVNGAGDTLSMGNAGGLNAPQFSDIDLNNDGIMDLLVYDRRGKVALTFLNGGTANTVDYTFAPEFMDAFPQGTSNFMLARDYNCDGIQDLFFFNRPPGSAAGVGVWKGSYDSEDRIQFTEVAERLTYPLAINPSIGITLPVANSDLPAIDDVDGDGDMDILTYVNDGFISLYWFKNLSVENGYGCDSLEFIVEHGCWGLFAESGVDNVALLSDRTDSCVGNSTWGRLGYRHAGASLALVDYDGNGTKDLVMGDVDVNHLNLLTTTNINDTLLAITQDVNFPSESVRTDIFSMPGAFFVDVDNDGKQDLLTSPNEVALGSVVTDSVVWWYKNTSATNAFDLDFQQKDFLVGDMLDLGEGAYPVFIDVTGDSLKDLLVGNVGYCQPDGSFTFGMTLLEQILDPVDSTISFQVMDDNYADLDTLELFYMIPTVADIDADGDEDLLLGSSEGELVFIENLAGAGNVPVWATPVRDYMGIDPGSNSAPEWVDIDRDGDFDLMVGENNGNINYFQNDGTPQSPMYSSTETDNFIGEFDLNIMQSGYSVPRFVDNNGEYELFLGHRAGGIIHLGNIDGNIFGAYDTLSMDFQGIYTGNYAAPAFADLDGNDTMEIVIGNARGGLIFYSNSYIDTAVQDTTDTVSVVVMPIAEQLFTIYPNPAQNQLTVELERSYPAAAIRVVDALGQVLAEYDVAGASQLVLPLGDWSNGVYFLQLYTSDGIFTRSFIKN